MTAPAPPTVDVDVALIEAINAVACEFECDPPCDVVAEWVVRLLDCQGHVTIDLLCDKHAALVKVAVAFRTLAFRCKECSHFCYSPRLSLEPITPR